MSSYQLTKYSTVQYVWVTNPRFEACRKNVWEASVKEWELITVASKHWRDSTIETTNRWFAQFNRVMAIGVANGEAFRDSHVDVYGVDKSIEIHDVARANSRLRGTPYTQTTVDTLETTSYDAVFVDCMHNTQGVIDYVINSGHRGPVLAVHKQPHVLHQLNAHGRSTREMSKAYEPTERHFITQPDVAKMNKSHVVLEIAPFCEA